jgi:hypothetical protein
MRSLLAPAKRRVGNWIFSEPVFAVVWRIAGPVAAGRFCARFVEPDAGGGAGEPCLCIDRDVFRKDITQLRLRTDRPWPAIKQQVLFLCLQAWLPRRFFVQARFQDVLPSLPSDAVDKAERFGTSFIRAVRARHGIAAIMTANVDYSTDEFLRRPAQREGIPFLALRKEHANSDAGQRRLARTTLTGYRFNGDGVAVLGPRTKALLVEQDVCPPDRIWVTGLPRLDEWLDVERRANPDTAVLFAFSREDRTGSQSFPAALAAFAAAARARADGTTWVVKCRDHYEEADVRAMVGGDIEGVEITSSREVPEVLSRAFLAVGYSSLAITEALMSRATVVSPRFGACINEDDIQFDDEDPQLRRQVCFPRSEQELAEELLRAPVAGVGDDAVDERREILEGFFCAPQPSFSALVDGFVADAIARSRGRDEMLAVSAA